MIVMRVGPRSGESGSKKNSRGTLSNPSSPPAGAIPALTPASRTGFLFSPRKAIRISSPVTPHWNFAVMLSLEVRVTVHVSTSAGHCVVVTAPPQPWKVNFAAAVAVRVTEVP